MPTGTLAEHPPSVSPPFEAGNTSDKPTAIPRHVRHLSKGGSGDYTREPSLVLKNDADKAIAILKKLTGGPGASKGVIPLDYLKRCKGLQFVVTRLGGLFVSVQRGHSFTIQRLGTDHSGLPLWSGPCFGTVSNFGVGLTAGYDSLDTVVVLSTQATVDKLKKGTTNFGVEIDLIMGKDSSLNETSDNWTEEQAAAIPFSIGGGALIDVSFRGGSHSINEKKNQGIYGPAATSEGILSGAISPPPEFFPLYELINQMAASSSEGFEATAEPGDAQGFNV